MAELNAALIAIAGVLAGGYVNNFLAEDYKRFRDGRTLAGALAGELESHGEALPMLKAGLMMMEEMTRGGQKLNMPEWPMPVSPLFDENASKIGQLGPDLAKGVAYVYENLRAFRLNFHQLSKHHGNMPPEWSHATILGCLAAIQRAETMGTPLIESLKSYADSRYLSRSETKLQLKYCAAAFIVFLLVVKIL